MHYRYFEHVPTLDRTDVLFKGEVLQDIPSQVVDIATAIGWPVEEARAVTVDSDPGPGTVTVPAAPPSPPHALEVTTAAEAAAEPQHQNAKVESIRLILAKEDADITQAELKVLILAMARFLFRLFRTGWRG